jgi:hypothetical protein
MTATSTPNQKTLPTGYGFEQAASGIYQSYQDGNDLQMTFRCIFSIVDLIIVPKAMIPCFTQDTFVQLQSEEKNIEQIVVMPEFFAMEKYSDSDEFSYMPYFVAGILTVIFCGMPNITNRKSLSKDQNKKIFLRSKMN